MAIQILGLRDYFNKKTEQMDKAERFFEKQWQAESVPDLFKNLDTYLAAIPVEEHYNLYYTASRCLNEKGRKIASQNIIPFDIDNIDVTRVDEYIDVFLKALDLDRDKTGIVFSGNGLQFIIGTTETIDYGEYFEERRPHYKAICGQVTEAFMEACLPAQVDPVVFCAGRLLRLPNTRNEKPKGNTEAKLLQGNIELIDFDLEARSPIPKVAYNEQISKDMLKRLPPPDKEGVLDGCDFIKHCRDNPNDIDEPQWYAMLSIVGCFDDAGESAHTISSGSAQYNESQTNRKLTQARTASGPRTCDSISHMFDACSSCPNWGKHKSPITIKGSGYIKTRDTGFYNIKLGKDGVPEKGQPNYDDLVLKFNEDNSFITADEGLITHVYTGTHYIPYTKAKLEQYAEENFDPKPLTNLCNEFRAKVQRKHVRLPEWFNVKGIINFDNGILDIDSMELSDHDDQIGLRYVLPFSYDPQSTAPRFEKFLNEVTCDDAEMQQVILEFIGCALSGIDPKLVGKALILVGDGANGKSVLLDTIKYMAGEGTYSTISMGSDIKDPTKRQPLDGKLFNISEETPSNAMLENSDFKDVITGGEMQVNKKYHDAYSMKPLAKIIMACNALPNTRDLSHGMFRRLLIVPFKRTFRESDEGYDIHIRDKLHGEASGIFNLAFNAFLRYKRNGKFTTSKVITEAVSEYQDTNDFVLTWWRECIVPNGDGWVQQRELYNAYKIDAEADGIKPMTNSYFGRKLKSILPDDTIKRTTKGMSVQGYKYGERTDEGF